MSIEWPRDTPRRGALMQSELFTGVEAPRYTPSLSGAGTMSSHVLGSMGEVMVLLEAHRCGYFAGQMSPDGVRNDIWIEHPRGLIGVQVKACLAPTARGGNVLPRYNFTLSGVECGEFDILAFAAVEHGVVAFVEGWAVNKTTVVMGKPGDAIPPRAVWGNVDQYPLIVALTTWVSLGRSDRPTSSRGGIHETVMDK
jgi:hypothetical protein